MSDPFPQPPGELPLDSVAAADSDEAADGKIVLVAFGDSAPLTVPVRLPGGCAHRQPAYDDDLERVVCLGCGETMPLYAEYKRLVNQYKKREDRIAYLEKLERERKQYESAVRRKVAGKKNAQRQDSEKAKLREAFAPPASQQQVKDLFSGIKRELSSPPNQGHG